MIGILVWKST